MFSGDSLYYTYGANDFGNEMLMASTDGNTRQRREAYPEDQRCDGTGRPASSLLNQKATALTEKWFNRGLSNSVSP